MRRGVEGGGDIVTVRLWVDLGIFVLKQNFDTVYIVAIDGAEQCRASIVGDENWVGAVLTGVEKEGDLKNILMCEGGNAV